MSDDAFALSPIAAQPPQPSEADYHALNEALSASARGRWFLSEFAKRNRNAETGKMLDAVARIEEAVATRSALTAANADLDIARTWAMAARAEAAGHLQAPEHEHAIAAAQRGTRIIREIAYSMRAVGNDPRICNILETQLDAIEAAQRAIDEPQKAVMAAFDRLIAQLDELAPRAALVIENVPKIPAASVRPTAPLDPEARFAAVADLAAAAAAGDRNIDLSPAEIDADDAMLDRIALEMAMEDETEVAPAIAGEAEAAPGTTAEPVMDAPVMEEPSAHKPADAKEPISLGAALLAQGLVPTPFKTTIDPFASLKRLTQAQTVALFT